MSKSHEVCEHRYLIGVYKDGEPTEWSSFPDDLIEMPGCSETKAWVRDFNLRNPEARFDITRTKIDHFEEWMEKNGIARPEKHENFPEGMPQFLIDLIRGGQVEEIDRIEE